MPCCSRAGGRQSPPVVCHTLPDGRPCVHGRRRSVAAALLACVLLTGAGAAAETRIELLDAATVHEWQPRNFNGETRYTWLPTENALEARSAGSASGLYRTIRIDLTRTPFLHWRWRVDNVLHGNDETRKAGDDYPARVYVVVSGGLLFWRTRAVNYVWASQRPVGSTWPNAYTGNAQMIALRSGADGIGEWRQERRDVRADLRRLFGKDITHIDAVALMTDTDDTGQAATAYYQGLYFSDR